MLTKDLLRYTKRGGKVFPKYIAPNDDNALLLAEHLIDLFKESMDTDIQTLEKEALEVSDGFLVQHQVTKGLIKLLTDRLEIEKPDFEEAAKFREAIFTVSSDLLKSGEFDSLLDYQSKVAKGVSGVLNKELAFDDIKNSIYSDLPQFATIKEFKDITPESLINRYNVAQVQGLLIYSKKLVVRTKSPKPEELRVLYKYQRFFSLLSHLSVSEEGITEITIDGPLSLFFNTKRYGIKIAMFFPAVLRLLNWEVYALIEIEKGNVLELLINSSKKSFDSFYKNVTAYIPLEVKSLIDNFNALESEWKMSEGSCFIVLAGNPPCFPDFEIEHALMGKVFLEVFHGWHKTQLEARIKQLEKLEFTDCKLILGVDSELLKNTNTKNILDSSAYFSKHGFSFNTFPSKTKVLSILKKL